MNIKKGSSPTENRRSSEAITIIKNSPAPDRTLYYEPQVKIRPLMDGNISLKLA